MPVLPLDVFWKKLAESQLLSANQIADVRAAYQELKIESGSQENQTAIAAQWLVRQRVLTLWQAKQLLKGNASNFFLGDYRLLDKRGMSPGGVVYQGRHEPTKQVVSLVPIDSSVSQRVDVWTEVVRQVERAAETTSPILSRTWALESAEGNRFIVCEDLVSQVSVAEVSQTLKWSVVEAVETILLVCRGVAEIHRLGGVHGMISTGTLVGASTETPSKDGLRLLQYPLSGDPLGIFAADSLKSPQSVAQFAESVCFVPPERLVTGKPVTPSGDVYAIGCLLHTLLVGRPVIWKGSPSATGTFICEEGRRDASLWPPIKGCPQEIQKLLDYMTATDPRRRYDDAVEAVDAIAACLQMSAVSPELPTQRAFQPNLIAVAAEGGAEAKPSVRGNARKQNPAFRILSVPSVLVGALLIAFTLFSMWRIFSRFDVGSKEISQVSIAHESAVLPISEAEKGAHQVGKDKAFILADDDSLPWMPPTELSPVVFRYLPSGSQLILSARPADFLGSKDGQFVLKAGGEKLKAVMVLLESLVKCSLSEIETLQVSWQADEEGFPLVAIWAHRYGTGVQESATAGVTNVAVPTENSGGWLRWYPDGENGNDVVVAVPQLMDALISTTEEKSELPRSMRPLEPVLDGNRHITLLGSPHFLVHDGRVLLSATTMPLLNPIENILGAGCPAAAVSIHLDDRTYFELDAVSPAVGSARVLNRQLELGLHQVSKKAEAVISSLDLDVYGRRLVMRLPEILRMGQRYLRIGIEGRDLVVANAYLPEMAAHNIMLAVSLLLDQIQANPIGSRVAKDKRVGLQQSAAVKLQRPVTLVFDSDSLETAVEMLSEAVSITIEIAGADLESEGITKNQSFGLSERDRPAEDVLRTILRKSESKPGQLIYVFREDGDGEKIVITTNTTAQQRGEKIPEVFHAVPVQ
jgi:serine/threonine protein kinase